MPSKGDVHKNVNALGVSGLSGQSITGLSMWRNGTIDIVEITTSSGTTFIKFRTGQFEVGGTANWGSGTAI